MQAASESTPRILHELLPESPPDHPPREAFGVRRIPALWAPSAEPRPFTGPMPAAEIVEVPHAHFD